MLLLANWKRWWPTCLCISAMNLLRSIFPLWSTSTSAMMVFTCSVRPISRILSRRHWKWLQKRWGGRQPPFLSDCTQGFSTAEESLWSQEGRCFSEEFQNAQHFFFASNNNFVNFTLSKSLKASFISEMKSSGISCKILSVFSQHTALTRTYIPEALLQTMVLTVFHFVQVRKS